MKAAVDEFLRGAGIDVSATAWSQLDEIFERMTATNREYNLTRITGYDEFLVKHVADSLLVAAAIPDFLTTQTTVADVGCGAGFPGLALALVFPECDFVAIDSVAKKTSFVNDTIAAIGLDNCRVVCGRARELGRQPAHAAGYGCVLARAVSDSGALIGECRRLLRPGGALVNYRTPDAIAAESQTTAREAAKYKLTSTVSPVFQLPGDNGARQFMILRQASISYGD